MRSLRTNYPPLLYNDNLIMTYRYWYIYNRHKHRFCNKTFCPPEISALNNKTNLYSTKFLESCLLYVVTETVGDYPYPYLTEKTWKAITSKTPFILIGARHSLKTLKSFGFKTFNQWWNENYDHLPTVAERIEASVIEIKKLSSMSTETLENMRAEMQETLDYNFNHLKTFATIELDNIQKNI